MIVSLPQPLVLFHSKYNNPPHLCVKKHYFTKTDNYDRQPNRESAVVAGIPAAGELPAAGAVRSLRRMLRLPANANHPRINHHSAVPPDIRCRFTREVHPSEL